MTVEDPVLTMQQWFLPGDGRLGGLVTVLIILPLLAVGIFFFAYLLTAAQFGPAAALGRVGSSLGVALRELFETSPRRVWAMTRLAFLEAMRRRVLVAFAIFVLVMLFASWYLDVKTDEPAQLYMGVVLGWTNLLVLVLALFLSTFSLPTDLRNRTIYTVVTKPVRLSEVVLGRMLGFTLIGTLILFVMCVLSYFFVWRGLSHTHEVEIASLVEDPNIVDSKGRHGMKGRTTQDDYHRHAVHINADGTGFTDVQKGHQHRITRQGTGKDAKYVVGPPVGQLQARMPIYGTLSFLDRAGNPTNKGINVGNEWTYRSFIEGGTLAAAIWTFDGVSRREFPESNKLFAEGIPIDLTLRVFRTYKGDIEEGILGSMEIVEYIDPALQADPNTRREPLVSEPVNFYAQEFTADRRYVPRKLNARRGSEPYAEVDLFNDMIRDGKLQIRVRCLIPAQYYGAAKPDVYLWTGNNYFWLNFAKGYLGIWFQMVLVIGFGVVFSTFLSGPVAMLATVMSYVVGFFTQFISDVTQGRAEGGGPLESFIRLVEQKNLVQPLDESVGTSVVTGFDSIANSIMWVFSFLMPDYSKFQTAAYVSGGYNIPAALMTQHFLITLLYFLVLAVIGYIIFRSREVAA